ncbi:MAG: DUF5615 family PIN-like protein [Pirellulales bacterium]
MTVQLLRSLGHDVAVAASLGLSRSADTTLLRTAKVQQRILITRDRDFGNLVFVDQLTTGVVYLRMLSSNLAAVHAELERVLERYEEVVLSNFFIVIQPGHHRLRRLPEPSTGDEEA